MSAHNKYITIPEVYPVLNLVSGNDQARRNEEEEFTHGKVLDAVGNLVA